MRKQVEKQKSVSLTKSIIGILLYLLIAIFATYVELIMLAIYGLYPPPLWLHGVENVEGMVFLLFVCGIAMLVQLLVLLFPFDKKIESKLLVQVQMHAVVATIFMLMMPFMLKGLTMPYMVATTGAGLALLQVVLIFRDYGEGIGTKLSIHAFILSAFAGIIFIAAL